MSEPWQTRTSDDGKGTHREMTLNGSVIVEDIYLNDSALEVTFVKSDGSGEVCKQSLFPPTKLLLALHVLSSFLPRPSKSTTIPSSRTTQDPIACSNSVCGTLQRSSRCTGMRPLM